MHVFVGFQFGGEGGTYVSYVFALQEQKAVFPLAGKINDAEISIMITS